VLRASPPVAPGGGGRALASSSISRRSGAAPKRNHRLVGWAEHALGLCMHWPAGQQCFGLAETCVSGLEGIGQPLPGHRSRPPPRVGPSLQPRLLGPGKQRATEPSRSAGATRCPGCWQGSARR
jgi:hypothetical protein